MIFDLYKEHCLNKKIKIRTVCEIGINKWQTCRVYDFISYGFKTILVEPQPELGEDLRIRFRDSNNVTVHQCAIGDRNGKIYLYRRTKGDMSAFIDSVPSSPMLHADFYEKQPGHRVEVDCLTMDKIDDGRIDILLIDAEGAEYFILKHLVSRPKLLVLEMRGPKGYKQNFLEDIEKWLKDNYYNLIKEQGEDNYYLRKEIKKKDFCIQE